MQILERLAQGLQEGGTKMGLTMQEFFFSCTAVTPEAVRAGGFLLAHGSRGYSPSW